jgi:hypothetical protein
MSSAARSVGAIMSNTGRPPLEHEDQCALVQWWALEHRRWNLPEFALFAVPNGGVRNIRTARRLKAEGVRRGVPDLILAAPRGPFHGAYVELKRETRGEVTPVQAAFGSYLRQAGYAYTIARGFDEAQAWIRRYLEGAA